MLLSVACACMLEPSVEGHSTPLLMAACSLVFVAQVEEQLSNIATDVTEVFTGTANEDDSGDPDDKTKGFQLQC